MVQSVYSALRIGWSLLQAVCLTQRHLCMLSTACLHVHEHSCISQYDGLQFTFPVPQKFASLLQDSTAAATSNNTATAAAYVPLEWPDGTSPVAVSLAVHAKADSSSSSSASSSSRQSSLLTALPTDDWTAVGQV
jgi:Uncharacterised protein family (UPF0183)